MEWVVWEGPGILGRLVTSRHLLPILFIWTISLVMVRDFLFSGALPAGTDMLGWIARPTFLAENGEILSTWSSQSVGEVRQFQMESIFAFFISLGFSAVALVKGAVLVGIALGGLGAYFLTHRYTSNRLAAMTAAVIFVNSQFFITRWTSGHLNLALGFALAPTVLLVLARLLERPTALRALTLSSVMLILTVAIRLDLGLYYLPFMVLFVAAHVAFPPHGYWRRDYVLAIAPALIGSAVVYTLVAAFVILPVLSGANPGFVSNATFPLAMHEDNSLGFMDTLLGKSRELGYLAVRDDIWWNNHPLLPGVAYEAVMGVIVAVAGLGFALRRNKMTGFFVAAAVLAVFLAKGPHGPLGEVYGWMYAHVPMFSDLRAPNRWLLFAVLSYAFLAGVAVQVVGEWLGRRFFAGEASSGGLSSLGRSGVPGFSAWRGPARAAGALWMGALLVITGLPVYPVYAEGLLTWRPPGEETAPHRFVRSDDTDFRIATVPYWQSWMLTGRLDAYEGLGESGNWVEHDIGADSGLIHGQPVLKPTWNVYGDDYVDYVREIMLWGGTKDLPKILGLSNVKYLVFQGYPPTTVPAGRSPEWERDFFAGQSGLTKVYSQEDVEVFENDYFQPLLSESRGSYLVVGGLGALNGLTTLEGYHPGEANLIFAHQVFQQGGVEALRGVLERVDGVVFHDSEPLDLAMFLAHAESRINAGDFGPVSDDPTGQWVQWGRNNRLGMMVNGGRTLTADGPASVEIPLEVSRRGTFEMWARVGFGPQRGVLNVSIDGDELARVQPETGLYAGLGWVWLGDVELEDGVHSLVLDNQAPEPGLAGGRNDVDQIVLLAPGALDQALDTAERLLKRPGLQTIAILEAERALRFDASEGVRWHPGRRWLANWGLSLAHEFDPSGESKTLVLDYQAPTDDAYSVYVRGFNPTISNVEAVVDGDVITGTIDGIVAVQSEAPDPSSLVYAGTEIGGILQAERGATSDWTGPGPVALWFEGEGTGRVLSFNVYFDRQLNARATYYFQDDFMGWRQLEFSRQRPDAVTGQTDWKAVQAVSVEMDPAGSLVGPMPVLAPEDGTGGIHFLNGHALSVRAAGSGAVVYAVGDSPGDWGQSRPAFDLWVQGQGTGRALELRAGFDPGFNAYASYSVIDDFVGWRRMRLSQPDAVFGEAAWGRVEGVTLTTAGALPLADPQAAFPTEEAWAWRNLNPKTSGTSTSEGVSPEGEVSRYLTLDMHTAPRGVFAIAETRFPEAQDWSDARYLSLWFKGQGARDTFQVTVFFGEGGADWVAYTFADTTLEWRQLQLRLATPQGAKGVRDWSNVSAIRLSTPSKETVGRFEIGGFQIAPSLDSPAPLAWTALTPAVTQAFGSRQDSEAVRSITEGGAVTGSGGETVDLVTPVGTRWIVPNPGPVEAEVIPSDRIGSSELALGVVRPATRQTFSMLEKTFGPLDDWRGGGVLGFWFKGTGSGEEFNTTVFFGGTHDNFARYPFADTVDGWSYVTLDLVRPEAAKGVVDWRQVWKLRLSSSDKEARTPFAMESLVWARGLEQRGLDQRWVSIDPWLSIQSPSAVTLHTWLEGARPADPVPTENGVVWVEPSAGTGWLATSRTHVEVVEEPGAVTKEESIRVSVEPGRPVFSITEKVLAPRQDWSEDRFFSFKFTGTSTGAMYTLTFFFGEGVKSFATYPFIDDVVRTKQVILRRDEPVNTNGIVDWSQVSRMKLATTDKGEGLRFRFGGFATHDDIDNLATLDKFQWFDASGQAEVKAGVGVRIEVPQGTELDQIMLVPTESAGSGGELTSFFQPARRGRVLSYERLSPTKYEVLVQVDEPFDLIFAEGFHPLWKATTEGGDQVDSTVSQGFVNSFYLPETGEYSVTIEFGGQRHAETGMFISMTTLLLVLMFFVLGPRRFRRGSAPAEERV